MPTSRWLLAVVVAPACAVIALALTPVLRAQSAAPPAPTSDRAIAALTTELRALRQDLAGAMRASTRMQLLLTRLQAQEQRMLYLDRQRGEVQGKLAIAAQDREATMLRMNEMEQVSRSGPPEQRRDIQVEVAALRQALDTAGAAENRLRAEESQVLDSLATEQARWNEFSARLEELERSLTTP